MGWGRVRWGRGGGRGGGLGWGLGWGGVGWAGVVVPPELMIQMLPILGCASQLGRLSPTRANDADPPPHPHPTPHPTPHRLLDFFKGLQTPWLLPFPPTPNPNPRPVSDSTWGGGRGEKPGGGGGLVGFFLKPR